MSDEEVKILYQELVDHYGDRLVNFEHYPKIFAYQVKMYLYFKGKE